MYQCGHYELVASAKAVKIGHEINPNFLIGNMIAMVPIYPFSCRPADMVLSTEMMSSGVLGSSVMCQCLWLIIHVNALMNVETKA